MRMDNFYIDDILQNYLSPDDILDFYIEASFAIRESELKMWHTIGKMLSKRDDNIRKQTAKLLKKHSSEIETAIKFYEKYPNFEDFPFDKATSWTSVKEQFGTREKRERKTLKEVVKQRYEKNISQEDTESRIRAEEDKAILSEVENDKNL